VPADAGAAPTTAPADAPSDAPREGGPREKSVSAATPTAADAGAQPDAPIAHPLGGDRVALLERSVAATAAGLSAHDARAWRTLFGPLSRDAGQLATELLGPVIHVPRHPLALARFGFPSLRSAAGLTRGRFQDDEARALFTGLAAHSMLDLRRPVSAAFGLVLGTFAHALGWPFIEGGSARLAAALAAELLEAGGTIEVDRPIRSFSELPSARVVVLDTSPRDAVAIAGERLDAGTRRALEAYRVPSRLVGQATTAGIVPRRLIPIFRDRDELASSSDLSREVNAALDQSSNLIVICSPRAVQSRWVNEEILSFESKRGRDTRIFCLIVDGEPNATAIPGREADECLPAALRHTLDAPGASIPGKPEPIAADARPGKDGQPDAVEPSFRSRRWPP